jgi:hypothetical protein
VTLPVNASITPCPKFDIQEPAETERNFSSHLLIPFLGFPKE